MFLTLEPGSSFVPEWYINAVLYQLERVRRGEIRQLIINLPPRSLKSMMASVAFPAYVLGQDPTRRIICVSYSSDLSTKLANDFRAIITAAWYKLAFPYTQIGVKESEGEITTRLGFPIGDVCWGTLQAGEGYHHHR